MARPTISLTAMQLAITAIFTSLVCVATMVFSIYVPQTRGFFNIGETMVYITALLFGPLIGSFAGGVGSMFADILLGYPHYAPATLVIKACEGGIVGLLGSKQLVFKSKLRWKGLTFAVGLTAGALLGIIGSLYFSGWVELYLGIPPPENPTSFFFVPSELWYSLAVLVFLLISLVGFVFEPEFGWHVLAILVGGLEMVLGYFLYEQLFLGVAAIAEVPVNLGQMAVGLIVSIPIVRAVRRSLPTLGVKQSKRSFNP